MYRYTSKILGVILKTIECIGVQPSHVHNLRFVWISDYMDVCVLCDVLCIMIMYDFANRFSKKLCRVKYLVAIKLMLKNEFF